MPRGPSDRSRPRCPACEYDRTGTEQIAACPECGSTLPLSEYTRVVHRQSVAHGFLWLGFGIAGPVLPFITCTGVHGRWWYFTAALVFGSLFSVRALSIARRYPEIGWSTPSPLWFGVGIAAVWAGIWTLVLDGV